MNNPIRVLVVDDHALVRESIGALLGSYEDISVIASVGSADEAVHAAAETHPDLVLMDIDMPGLIAFDAAGRIKEQDQGTAVLFVSGYLHDHYVAEALAVRASGYLLKTDVTKNLVTALREVGAGGTYFSPEIAAKLEIDEHGARFVRGRTPLTTLSRRETEVLRYVARGLTKKEVAQTMGISVKTVEGHTQNVMKKLDIHNRVGLTRFAIREGLERP